MVVLFSNCTILLMRFAWLSKPTGKITREVAVFICCHFKEAGLPPKFCAINKEGKKSKDKKGSINFFTIMKQSLEKASQKKFGRYTVIELGFIN